MRKSHAWRRKLPLALAVLILAALAGAVLTIDWIALDQINRALKRHLTEGGRLEKIDVRLATIRLTQRQVGLDLQYILWR